MVLLLVTVLVASASRLLAGDVRVGLVSYWPLQTINTSSTPNTTPDLVSGYDMSLMNMSTGNLVPTTNPENAGLTNAMTFDGTSTYLQYTNGGNLPISVSPAFSVLLWVQGSGSQVDAKVFAEGSTASTAPTTTLGTQSAGTNNSLRFFIRNPASAVLLDTPSTNTSAPFDSSWHHIAVVVSNGLATIYIDGMLDHTSSFSGTISGLNTTTIGAILRTSLSYVFTGQINDVAVWARALSQGEIQNVMTTSIQTPVPGYLPIVTVQPVGATNLFTGASWTFTGGAVGVPTSTFQWYWNGINLPGVTNNIFTLSNVHPTNSGNYYFVASNASGSVTSAVVQLLISNVSILQGLVSYWPLQTINTDTTPNTTPDLMSGNDMSLMNMGFGNLVPTTNPSNAGLTNAMAFDGTSTYLQYTNGGNLPISVSPAFSVLLWVQGYGSQLDTKVFAEGSTVSSAPAMTIGTRVYGDYNSARLFLRNAANTTLLDDSTTNYNVFDNNWHHIAVVVNNGVFTLYIDGVLDNSGSFSGTISGLNTTTIGAILRTSLSGMFTGQINDVAVWNRALVQSEIQNVMANSIESPGLGSPVVAVQPVGANLFSGASWTFTGRAVGVPTPTLQWYWNGASLVGATNNTFTLLNLNPTNSGNYYFVARNPSGSVTSAVVQLVVSNPLNPVRVGLVSYWPLRTINTNTTPNTTPDLVSGYDMSLIGMGTTNLVPATNPGNAGLTNAMTFNGTSTYLKYTGGGNLPISVSPAFSMLLWVQGSGANADKKVFAEGSTASTAPATTLGTQAAGANNGVRLYIRNAASTVLLDTTSTNTAAPFNNSWHHIAVVVNNGVAAMYIDGVLDHSSSFSGTISGLNTTTIGGLLRTSLSGVFAGQINDVAVWARALAQGEIQNVMTNSIQASHSAISGIAKISASSLQVSGTGDVSQLYSVWSTTNVTLPGAQWLRIGTTNSTSAGLIKFTDTNATNANRFYRFGQ